MVTKDKNKMLRDNHGKAIRVGMFAKYDKYLNNKLVIGKIIKISVEIHDLMSSIIYFEDDWRRNPYEIIILSKKEAMLYIMEN
jgi:hypothetical protein